MSKYTESYRTAYKQIISRLRSGIHDGGFHQPWGGPRLYTSSNSEMRDKDIEALIRATGADIRYGGDEAVNKTLVSVHDITGERTVEKQVTFVPDFSQFKSPDDYYGVALHELVHWSAPYVGRNAYHPSRHGKAREEIIAQLGSAFICSALDKPLGLWHSSYIAHVIDANFEDESILQEAAPYAAQAATFLLSRLESRR